MLLNIFYCLLACFKGTSKLEYKKSIPVEKPRLVEEKERAVPSSSDVRKGIKLVQVDRLINFSSAEKYNVSGEGLAAAVIDSGVYPDHVDFENGFIIHNGRMVQRNFSKDNGRNPSNALDGHGHGTHICGIITANGIHRGVAKDAKVVPLKVLRNRTGNCRFSKLRKALVWVLRNYDRFGEKISVVNVSIGDGDIYQTDQRMRDSIKRVIKQLREKRIAVVIAAGNSFWQHDSLEGMEYPAIFRECISVGAVFDDDVGGFKYKGAEAYSTSKDQITPFTSRLHQTTNQFAYTKIFAPGAVTTCTGIKNRQAVSKMYGTSQAVPVISGTILLIQELYKRKYHEMPTIEKLIHFLQEGATKIYDGDNENDNVTNTKKYYFRVNVEKSLSLV